MPTFDTVGQMETYIMLAIQSAVKEEEMAVERVFQHYLDAFYGEYYPERYVRTFMLLNHAMHFDETHKAGNGYEFTVWFDGHWETGNWSDTKILEVNLTGSHGGVADGTNVWEYSLSEINDCVFDDLKESLRANGVPIV